MSAPWLTIDMELTRSVNHGFLLYWRLWVVALMATISMPSSVFADIVKLPPNWPWHGVNISALNGKNTDLVRYKHELNINMVRLHFNNHSFKGMSSKVVINTSFQWLDQILDDCAKLGITAVINLDFFPLGEGAKIKSTPEFWNNQKYRNEMVEVTRKFAAHFKSRGRELAAYDVISEPLVYVDGKARTPNGWVYFQAKLLQTLRQVDSKRWIVFAPGPGGGPEGYKNYVPPIGEKIVWGVHIYVPHSFTHQGIYNWPLGYEYPGVIGSDMWDKNLLKAAFLPVLDFQKKYAGPVWVGEFSAVRWAKGSEQYLRDVTDIFNENNWGWTYFSGLDWHGWHPDFDSEFSTDQDSEKHRVGFKSERWKTLKEIFVDN